MPWWLRPLRSKPGSRLQVAELEGRTDALGAITRARWSSSPVMPLKELSGQVTDDRIKRVAEGFVPAAPTTASTR